MKQPRIFVADVCDELRQQLDKLKTQWPPGIWPRLGSCMYARYVSIGFKTKLSILFFTHNKSGWEAPGIYITVPLSSSIKDTVSAVFSTLMEKCKVKEPA